MCGRETNLRIQLRQKDDQDLKDTKKLIERTKGVQYVCVCVSWQAEGDLTVRVCR